MALLIYLVNRPGTVVSRKELEDEVWKDVVVGYDALNNTIAKLRKAFNDNPKEPQVIHTVPKKGYRLIAEVGVSPLSTETETLTASGSESHPSLERKLAAIVYADVVDYSKLTGLDEEGTHRSLSKCLDLMTASIERYHGSVVHFAGDAILAEFSTASNALGCAATMQQELAVNNEGIPAERKMQFRIGVNLGEVIVDRNDIYGDGVNVAARLEGLAEPGGICLSGAVFDAIGHQLPLDYNFLGERRVKNIDKPVRAYQARLKPGTRLEPPTTRITTARGRSYKPWIIGVSLTLVLAVVVSFIWLRPSPPDKSSIAVLPFENISDDPAQEFYADGMTGDLITDLSSISGLSVIDRHTVMILKGQPVKLEQIAQDLNVSHVLEGSIRRFDGKIRINVNLIDAGNMKSVWSKRYDGNESEIFDVHSQVINSFVSALGIQLTEQEREQNARPPTNNLEAYDYYLRAEKRRYSHGENKQWVKDINEAIKLYRKAIELDPGFAQAYAGLAWIGLDIWTLDETDIMPGVVAKKLAYDSVSRVNEIDPRYPDTYSVLAILQATEKQHEIALESSLKAIEFGPGNADAWISRAEVLTYAGKLDDAEKALSKSLELNPNPPEHFYGLLGNVQYLLGKYEIADKTMENLYWYREHRLMTYGQLGRKEQAKALLKKNTEFANLVWYRARYSHYKRPQDWQHMIDGLQKAGVPEYAFGFEGDPQHLIKSGELEALAKEGAWMGSDQSGTSFIQQITADGRVVLKNNNTLLVGKAWTDRDMFCVKYQSNMRGQDDCGNVFRNPGGSREQQNEYIWAAAGAIYYFTIDE
jgi:adenylate cyclase